MAHLDKTSLDKLRKLGGDEFVAEIVETFLSDAPERVEAALKAGAAEDWEGVERATHSLASSAAMLGAGELHDLGRSIEHRAAARATEGLADDVRRLGELYAEYATLLKAEIATP